jgi:hypothetical protein
MQKLMPERIARISEAPLTDEDKKSLTQLRNRQLSLFVLPYCVLLGFGIYLWMSGTAGLSKGRIYKNEYDDEDAERFSTVAPYVFGFFILMATIYFSKQFFQLIYPLIKDIRAGKKSLIFYKPAKSAMPFFNKYYLSTPLYKSQQIEISREDFDSIPDNRELCLEAGPSSVSILRLMNDGKEIKFY